MCINCPKSNSYEDDFNEILDAASAVIGQFNGYFCNDLPGGETSF